MDHQICALWLEGAATRTWNWDLAGDLSVTAAECGLQSFAALLLASYDKRDGQLLYNALLPDPATFIPKAIPAWRKSPTPGSWSGPASRQPTPRAWNPGLLHVETGFRFEWFPYVDEHKRPRHQILISADIDDPRWPTVDDVLRGFPDAEYPQGYIWMLGTRIGHVRNNSHIRRRLVDVYPHTVHLWYDERAWFRLHDLFVNVWKNLTEHPTTHYHVLFGLRGYMPDINEVFATHAEAVEYANDLAHQLGDEDRVEGDPEAGDWVVGEDGSRSIEVTECDEAACLEDLEI